jgi:hypothetical protein
MEDEDIIARASSGLALCGTHVGISDGGRRALKRLLRRPTDCKLIGPQQMFKVETLSFSSIDASQRFCQAVEKSGWSFAVSASSPLNCLLTGNISLDVAKVKGKEDVSGRMVHRGVPDSVLLPQSIIQHSPTSDAVE